MPRLKLLTQHPFTFSNNHHGHEQLITPRRLPIYFNHLLPGKEKLLPNSSENAKQNP